MTLENDTAQEALQKILDLRTGDIIPLDHDGNPIDGVMDIGTPVNPFGSIYVNNLHDGSQEIDLNTDIIDFGNRNNFLISQVGNSSFTWLYEESECDKCLVLVWSATGSVGIDRDPIFTPTFTDFEGGNTKVTFQSDGSPLQVVETDRGGVPTKDGVRVYNDVNGAVNYLSTETIVPYHGADANRAFFRGSTIVINARDYFGLRDTRVAHDPSVQGYDNNLEAFNEIGVFPYPPQPTSVTPYIEENSIPYYGADLNMFIGSLAGDPVRKDGQFQNQSNLCGVGSVSANMGVLSGLKLNDTIDIKVGTRSRTVINGREGFAILIPLFGA